MEMQPRMKAVVLTACGALAVGAALVARRAAAAEAAPQGQAPAAPPRVTVLRMARQWTDPTKDPGGTIWRYHETWRTDVVRAAGGQLVPVEPYVFRRRAKAASGAGKGFEIAPAKTAAGSAFPPEAWPRGDFDDGRWLRQPGPLRTKYRSLALTCIRGKFQVTDPRAVSDLSLDVSFQGGAAAYLNGREVGRAFLPPGGLRPDTLAEDYPRDTYESGLSKRRNALICQTLFRWNTGPEVAGPAEAGLLCRNAPPEEKARFIERYRKRFRTLKAHIPGSALRKGVNVLAVEVHRAPANPVMFAAVRFERDTDGNSISNFGWNRCLIDDVTLTAAAKPGAIAPNVSRPAGMQVWNVSTQFRLLPTHYGDPCEPLRPVRLFGLPNGLYSCRLVVSAGQAVRGLKVSVSDLAGAGGAVVPAANVQIGYEQWARGEGHRPGTFDAIETAAPPEVPAGAIRLSDRGRAVPGAMQPIWITVKVPRGARGGEYAGKIAIEAAGEKTVEVPLKLRVVSEWALPGPRQFTTFVGAIQSPDSVALHYKVPMWSEAHWKLLDRTFALMAEIGVRDVHIPLLARTNLGNADSMVRWVRQPDGSSKPDLAIVQRYLDTACRHLGRPPVVVLWIHDRPFFRSRSPMIWAGRMVTPTDDATLLPYTQVDPATGLTSQPSAPLWGTPEARAFWKPVIEALREALARRGLGKSMFFGTGTHGYVGPKCVADTQALAPDVPWYNRTHGGTRRAVGRKGARQPVRYNSEGHTCHLSVDWDPDAKARYVWTAPPADGFLATTSAWHLTDKAELSTFRTFAEATLLSRWCGISNQGVDFRPRLKGPDRFGGGSTLIERYTWQHGVDSRLTQQAFLGAGRDGPAATPRLRLMREALQEAEVRIVVQNALLDEAARARLGPDLARRASQRCDGRTRMLRYFSWYLAPFKYGTLSNYDRYFDEASWMRSTEQLEELAQPAAKALAGRT